MGKGKEMEEERRNGKGKRGMWIPVLGIIVLGVACICSVPVLREEYMVKKEKDMFAETKVVLYEGPKSLRDATEEDLVSAPENKKDMALLHSTDTQVSVNGEECYVYETNVNHSRNWNAAYLPSIGRTPIAYFDFEGIAEITVTVPAVEIESVKISPLSAEITPVVDNEAHTVTFRVTTPDTYTLQFNDSPARAVHIFANALEKEEEIPDFDDPDVIYIGPGEWDIETISMKKGQTLYLAGGAVVHGVVNASFVSDVRVCGRGIIDGSGFEGWQGKTAYIPLKFDHCSNVKIEDVIVLNSNAWCCQAYDSTDGVIDGLKIISARPNGDGISLQSCQNYMVENCFVRSWDDSLVVKNYDVNSMDVTFRHMQLWTDLAQSMEVGYETNKGRKADSSITNILFEDITVLNNFHKPVISVHNGDDALLDNIVFRDVTVEYEAVGSGDGSEMPYLIDINIMQSSNWSTTLERGQIRGIVLENINFMDGRENPSRIKGYDAEHTVDGVTIKNLTLFGKEIKSAEDGNFQIDEKTVSNVTFQ